MVVRVCVVVKEFLTITLKQETEESCHMGNERFYHVTNLGALIIRIGLGVSYTIDINKEPQNAMGKYLRPYTRCRTWIRVVVFFNSFLTVQTCA